MKMVWIFLAVGSLAAVVIVAILGFPEDEKAPTIERLKWTDPISTPTPEEFYGTLRKALNGVSRDGDVITLDLAGGTCAAQTERWKPLVPNGIRLQCRERSRTIWVLDKR